MSPSLFKKRPHLSLQFIWPSRNRGVSSLDKATGKRQHMWRNEIEAASVSRSTQNQPSGRFFCFFFPLLDPRFEFIQTQQNTRGQTWCQLLVLRKTGRELERFHYFSRKTGIHFLIMCVSQYSRCSADQNPTSSQGHMYTGSFWKTISVYTTINTQAKGYQAPGWQ